MIIIFLVLATIIAAYVYYVKRHAKELRKIEKQIHKNEEKASHE